MVFIATIQNRPFWPMVDNLLNFFYKKRQIKINFAPAEVDENANFCKVEMQDEYRISGWE